MLSIIIGYLLSPMGESKKLMGFHQFSYFSLPCNFLKFQHFKQFFFHYEGNKALKTIICVVRVTKPKTFLEIFVF